jgi:hypothetical protein
MPKKTEIGRIGPSALTALSLGLLILMPLLTAPARAAVGCDLNDPARDVKLMFPESTGYKTVYVSVARAGGEALLRKIESRLQDRFRGLYETIDVPYTMYEIYRGEELIGYIHGVNQKGSYGGIQVFLALTAKGVIRGFYVQKFTGRSGKLFRSREFAAQLLDLSLADFKDYDVVSGREEPEGRIAGIRNPAPDSENDFRAILRAVKKNLILVDELLLGGKNGTR